MPRKYWLFLGMIFFILLIYKPVLCQWRYHINDHLGNTRVVLDDNGDVKEYYDYYPFGMTRRENITGSDPARHKFTGKELDEEGDLGWYYFGARYYDPKIGRWLSPDPLADMYPSLSPYVYCANNPINLFDPNGMEVVGDSVSVASGAAMINQALKDKGIDNATATVGKRTEEKKGLSRLWAKLTGGSTTKTVFYIAQEGEGWNNLSANDPLLSAEDNALATNALNMLKDILDSPDQWNLHYTDNYKKGSLSQFFGGGINEGNGNVYVSPLGNRTYKRGHEGSPNAVKSANFGEPSLGIFFHELVGGSHPNSKNASLMNYLFNNRFGSQKIPGHHGVNPRYLKWRF